MACASAKKANVAKLWWKLAEIEVPPLAPEHARVIAQTYLTQTGTLVESPPLFVAHVVQQANGNPQALAAVVLSVRVFLVRGAGKANSRG